MLQQNVLESLIKPSCFTFRQQFSVRMLEHTAATAGNTLELRAALESALKLLEKLIQRMEFVDFMLTGEYSMVLNQNCRRRLCRLARQSQVMSKKRRHIAAIANITEERKTAVGRARK